MDTPQAKFEVGDKVKVISQEKTNERFGIHSDMTGVGDTFLVEDRYYINYKGLWSYTDVNGFSYSEEDLESLMTEEDETKFKVGDLVKVISHLETNRRFGYSKKMRQIGDTFTIKKSCKAPTTGIYYHCDKGYAYDEGDLILVENEPEFEVGDKVEVISREKTTNRFGTDEYMVDVGDTFFIYRRYYNDYKGMWSYDDTNGFVYDERDLKKFVRPEPEFEVGDKVRVVDTKNTFERYGYNKYMKNVGDEFVVRVVQWSSTHMNWYYMNNSFKYVGADLELSQKIIKIKRLPDHVILRNAQDENDRTIYIGVKEDQNPSRIAVMKYGRGGTLTYISTFTNNRAFTIDYDVVKEMALTGLRYVVVGDIPPVGDPLEARREGMLHVNHPHEHLPF